MTQYLHNLLIRFLKESDFFNVIYHNNNINKKILNKQIKDAATPKMAIAIIALKLKLYSNNNEYYSSLSNTLEKIQIRWEEFYLNRIHHKTRIKIFEEFLTKNNLIHIYEKINQYTKNKHNYQTIESAINNNIMVNVIDKAFTWNKTDEGEMFYLNLSKKLKQYIHEYYTYM